MDILDDMGVSKLSAKVFLKVNYSFKPCQFLQKKMPCVICLQMTRFDYLFF